ncbi:type IVB secretion system protein IcmO/DotL [Legionella pneumophila]|uniref:Protein IcmO (DotL) n=1 Tax=Legionella pneumophila subsp. pascullei TaxID=91890 RepID=A0AAX2IT81_LEGPN|nr:type IVB secretion system protein IcmO/DotL [Legionella pneumophila]AMP88596.1 phosphoesterase [Legionella pneumophila subsp. pascullei]AMP91505.1 phosphoesterase [Legionella pneumophila subsp. pascullei]AMP94492.1 phosphoesterase [Legionella pneumophila subsp. pascullei]SQG89294.1 protein IcmO (DotL) [Legionella pneumophila subsp. pascullei]VEH04423.1 protein IcmO (DotL) [Legionella pneumophila subsp. pascullei]
MMRGIDSRHELDPTLLLRDTRTFTQRLADFFADPTNISIVLISLAAVSYYFSESATFLLIMGGIFFLYSYTRKQKLPFRLPQISRAKDYNDLKPGINKPNIARGITFFGNDRKTGEELWFANDDMRTHALIFGSTGSGKTETLVSLSYNALVQGSGFIYVDGKGDNSLYAKVFSMVRSMGREDDLLLINFMTGARDIVGPQEKRLSNTLNPFCQGSSSMLTQLVVSLMGSSGQSSDGDMWKGRAIAFVEALMRLLVYMRDEGAILLDANTIRNYFDLQRLESIVIDKVFPRDDQESVNIETIPKLVTDPLRNYLNTLPGYNKEKKGKQVSQVLEQHGFITMQLVRSFSSLADTYGHIIRTNLAEVDFKDVVLNRRILVVLLPALEKSPDELSNLGKIIVSSLKAMMAAGLGEEVEGDYRDVILRKPTNAPTPYMCILDEYGYYAVQGFAVVPAQARSLGFSAIFAGQDLPAFQKASKEEAASIGANTNIKICMKLEDPTETWDFFTKTAGEAYVTKVDSFQTKETSIANSYMDTKSSSFEKRARVDLLDLKEQTEGEAHIFFKSKIVRARMFYANPKPVKQLKINQFLKVEPPPDDYLMKLQKQLASFQSILESGDLSINKTVENEEITLISKALKESTIVEPIERGVAALIAFHGQNEPEPVEDIVEEEVEGALTIFSKLRIDPDAPPILVADKEAFSEPLLPINETRNQMITIERLAGAKDKYAGTVANELIKDFQIATSYPPEERDVIDNQELTDIIRDLSAKISAEREKANKKAAEELT